MLNFINNNGTLCTIIGSIITALIAAIVAIVIDHRKNKVDTICNLRKEITDMENKLAEYEKIINEYKSIELAEKAIDKSNGAVYIEKLSNDKTRFICGYCWESSRTKMPLRMASYYDEEDRELVEYGICGNYQAHCHYE